MPAADNVTKYIPKNVMSILLYARGIFYKHKYKNLTTAQIFQRIYQDGTWGRSNRQDQPFFSGTGSHNNSVVSAYTSAVESFLASLEKEVTAVDLGCGDFTVGSKIRPLCKKYIACDIVPELIEFNRRKYNNSNTEFRVINIIEDELPLGDVAFLRQVLQHLSNDQITLILPKLRTYKHLIVTEHIPAQSGFLANIDKPTGPDLRLGFNSGVVLTREPFNFRACEETILCDHYEYGGLIRTIHYKLDANA